MSQFVKKVKMQQESQVSYGGDIVFTCSLFCAKIHLFTSRKYTHSTSIRKQAKRKENNLLETTHANLILPFHVRSLFVNSFIPTLFVLSFFIFTVLYLVVCVVLQLGCFYNVELKKTPISYTCYVFINSFHQSWISINICILKIDFLPKLTGMACSIISKRVQGSDNVTLIYN